MARVILSDLHKRYGDTHVVKGVSIEVEDGEFLVLVGPSGCGKSTCLRMVAGLETISSGTIAIGDRIVNDVAPKDRDIGMVFQSYALYPHMTVRQNLAFGLTLRKAPKAEIEERVAEAARILAIGELLDRRPKALSGGQRQRVAMGRAIVRRPQVFLFDEPLSNLDAALRVQMRAELGALHRRLGTTMIYVTHDQVEAMTLATRIAVLHDGILQQVGPALELYHRPANRFVAGFIGSPAMNFLPGDVASEAGAPVFVAGGLRVPLTGPVSGAGEGFTLGIRPHQLELALGELAGGAARLEGEVVVVEPMGWEAFVHVETPAGRVVAQIPGDRAARLAGGETIGLAIHPERAYLFGASGETLLVPDVGR